MVVGGSRALSENEVIREDRSRRVPVFVFGAIGSGGVRFGLGGFAMRTVLVAMVIVFGVARALAGGQKLALIVFSHGLGASREMYGYFGKHMAEIGYDAGVRVGVFRCVRAGDEKAKKWLVDSVAEKRGDCKAEFKAGE